jgi:hypothetical protein
MRLIHGHRRTRTARGQFPVTRPPTRRGGRSDLAAVNLTSAPHCRAGTEPAQPTVPSPPLPRRPRSVVLLCLLLVVAGLVLSGSVAWAETVRYVALAQTVDQVLSNIRSWIMGILAGVALVFLTVGGLRYLMASGDPGEIEKAKGAFKAAGIGFALAALAPIVVEILKTIVGGV